MVNEENKIKVLYVRDKCTACCTCTNLDSENWVMNTDDAKADLLNSEKEGKLHIAYKEKTMQLQMAADQCPERIIVLKKDLKKI